MHKKYFTSYDYRYYPIWMIRLSVAINYVLNNTVIAFEYFKR